MRQFEQGSGGLVELRIGSQSVPVDSLKFRNQYRPLNPRTVAEYAELISSNHPLDPPVVFYDDGGNTHDAGGEHRAAAHKLAGRSHITIDVRKGDRLTALVHAVKENSRHGERLTLDDKRNALRLLLLEKSKLSVAVLAGICSLSDRTITKYRDEMISTGEISPLDEVEGLDGRTYRVTTRHTEGVQPRPGQIKPEPLSTGQPPDEVTDTVSVNEPAKKRHRKPLYDFLSDSIRTLGMHKKSVDAWRDILPAEYRAAMADYDRHGRVFEELRKHHAN